MRALLPIVIVLVLVGAIVLMKAAQIGKVMRAGKAAEAAGPPPEVVATALATEATWEATLPAVGSVETAKGVALSVEVPGVVSALRFESGAVVKKGDVLLELESNVERSQLQAAVARRTLAASNLARKEKLLASGTIAIAELESDQAALKTAEADAAALQAQIARKTLRAPFAGKLGIRAVNLGQYLSPGTTVTTLETSDTQFVDFTLPQQLLGEVAIGNPVRIRNGGGARDGGVAATADGAIVATVDGAIVAIDPTVDPVTRSLRLRADVPDKEKKLRPGMFVEVSVVLPKKHAVISVPITAIVHASYGDSLFVVEPGETGKIARQQFVRTGETRGDFVAVEQGLTPGQEVVVSGAFKLRNNAKVAVNNDVKPAASVAPQPENR
ncbi:MAG: efflux RND transporter periplasmic adaptor subunit [Deltaproteobacteria bacterium]|nr:efflux RND transporter periplasmic adaptor subunit [Deltaproteobacteria bacterium]